MRMIVYYFVHIAGRQFWPIKLICFFLILDRKKGNILYTIILHVIKCIVLQQGFILCLRILTVINNVLQRMVLVL